MLMQHSYVTAAVYKEEKIQGAAVQSEDREYYSYNKKSGPSKP